MTEDFSDLDWSDEGEDSIIAPAGMLTSVPYDCAACGELNQTMLDPGGGLHQRYTEDCEVCCRPNLLSLTIDPETRIVGITNELEYL